LVLRKVATTFLWKRKLDQRKMQRPCFLRDIWERPSFVKEACAEENSSAGARNSKFSKLLCFAGGKSQSRRFYFISGCEIWMRKKKILNFLLIYQKYS
jgi:hypothetical protein